MGVIPLESLPLGFRFRPTDEELINHYLKNKNNGRVHDVEVIPEVDVCKCEPWDLPEKSLIPTGDPEWFFYAPRDRKYPNGHRSNRATEAGYWKATGKDRTIKSRSVGGTTPIGMKKTLVFYRGRAPRGERTGWIMHEYRVTGLASENDDDRANGYQGAYVLCRLFKKPEERTSNPNCDEVEDSGFFHTPASSSPYDAQHAEDAVEDSQTPSNQEISESDAQEDPNIFLANIQKQSDGINSSFADKVHSRTKHPEEPEESKFNGNTVSKYDEGEVEPEMDPWMEALNRICGTQLEPTDTDDFPRIDSPIYMDDIFSDISHIYHLGPQGVDIDPQDSMSEYLGPVLNQDEYSLGGSYNQGSIANPHSINMPPSVHHLDMASGKDSGSSSDADTELGMQQVQKKRLDTDISELLDTESCSSQNLTNPENVNPVATHSLGIIYRSGHANQILYDHARMEVSSLGIITESPQDAYSVGTFGVSTNQSTLVSENNGLGGTGIAIRSRQLQYPVGAPTSLQGTATRRIRLQKNFHKQSSSNSTGADSSLEDDEVRSANSEERQDVQEPSEQHACKEEEPSQPASIHKTEIPNPDETPLVQVAPATPDPIDVSKGSNPAGLRSAKLNDKKGYEGGGRSAPLNLTQELPPTLPRVTFVTLALTFLVALVGVAWKCLKD